MQQQADGWNGADVPGDGSNRRNGWFGPELPQFATEAGAHASFNPIKSNPVLPSPSGFHPAFGLGGLPAADHPMPGLPAFAHADSLATLVHDTRNMVSALDLYCDLLEEPGVLSPSFRHYAGELRLVGGASRRLLEKLSLLDCMADGAIDSIAAMDGIAGRESRPFSSPDRTHPDLSSWNQTPSPSPGIFPDPSPDPASDPAWGWSTRTLGSPALPRFPPPGRHRAFQESTEVANLAEELLANQNLLSALAGPGVTVGLSLSGGQTALSMTGDDLTRVLVNLTRNAAEAMTGRGHIQIALEQNPASMTLTFSDSGPGVPDSAMDAIFSPGYTTHVNLDPEADVGYHLWPRQHRGLGLSIVRSIVAAAGGSVWVANQTGNPPGIPKSPAITGAIFGLEFPLVT